MVIMLSFFLITTPAKAEKTDDVNVKPNEYQKQDVEVNTNYFQEDPEDEKNVSAPDELKDLSFDIKQTDDSKEKLKEISLSTNGSNSAVEKLKNLSFAGIEKASSKEEKDTPTKGQQTIFLPILYGVLILLGITILIFLIPRVTGQQKARSKS
ncbi:type VII secretion protein EssA [Bacillus changyiensis]|uniref:type VII secretion protein EssA n=1 Tax=Bacillus changyiensis TaxID=3004103 RepID=UPI0022E3EB2E|nr:type VII secretion protein EssA [Bacillus changyiensis]MDA1476263.1 type VII secretion protein EssA [Bacillus changyiensis]